MRALFGFPTGRETRPVDSEAAFLFSWRSLSDRRYKKTTRQRTKQGRGQESPLSKGGLGG